MSDPTTIPDAAPCGECGSIHRPGENSLCPGWRPVPGREQGSHCDPPAPIGLVDGVVQLIAECDALRARVAELERERDEARAEVKRLRVAARHAEEALIAAMPSGHDGDEESGRCDPDCARCLVEGALAFERLEAGAYDALRDALKAMTR